MYDVLGRCSSHVDADIEVCYWPKAATGCPMLDPERHSSWSFPFISDALNPRIDAAAYAAPATGSSPGTAQAWRPWPAQTSAARTTPGPSASTAARTAAAGAAGKSSRRFAPGIDRKGGV